MITPTETVSRGRCSLRAAELTARRSITVLPVLDPAGTLVAGSWRPAGAVLTGRGPPPQGDMSQRERHYREAINRYLGSVGYQQAEQVRPTAASPVTAIGTVLVGVDETPSGITAVDHAAAEADLHGWRLQLFHVQHPGDPQQASRDEGARLWPPTTPGW